MNLREMKKLVEILEQNGLKDTSYFDFNHDIVFIPVHNEDVSFANQLEAIGCHWDSEFDCWAHF